MGSKIKPEDRKHSPHQHLKVYQETHLHQIMKLRMLELGSTDRLTAGWDYVDGWNAARIARSEGLPYTHHNVRSFRNKHYPEPQVIPQPDARPVPHDTRPAPDAAGMFWERLDHQTAAIVELTRVVETVLAPKLNEQGLALNQIMKMVLAIANEWKVKS